MSTTDPRRMKVRVYTTEVDDSGGTMWVAEAGWPSGVGEGWIVFAECAHPSEKGAIEALYGMLYRRCRLTEAAIRRLGSVMIERGFHVGMDGRLKASRAAIARARGK